ncbi:Ryncolin-1 [Lamellibrachia satsuma]|nr:Ryncolin-1 [Lamellibrachia satsuma]
MRYLLPFVAVMCMAHGQGTVPRDDDFVADNSLRRWMSRLEAQYIYLANENEKRVNAMEQLRAENEKIVSDNAYLRQELATIKAELKSQVYDCADLLKEGHTVSGVYNIYLNKAKRHIQVYCDMQTDGGGWLVFQRRQDGTVGFYRDWNSYKTGFGNVSTEFWLGNDILHDITSNKRYELRVDMEDYEGEKRYATYSRFAVASEDDNYRLKLVSYCGTAGDSLAFATCQPFTTKDRDNDKHADNCARMFKGAWWYTSCYNSNLNGLYLGSPEDPQQHGIDWEGWRKYYSLKKAAMKLRP